LQPATAGIGSAAPGAGRTSTTATTAPCDIMDLPPPPTTSSPPAGR
jgi:hypothetical protein